MADSIKIDAQQFIKDVILREIKTIVYSPECKSAPYVKFVLIATGIEFLGACGDPHPYNKEKEGEDRFNAALNKYFNKKYQKYAKKGSAINLYEDFRCGMIHQLRPTHLINLTERGKGHNHLDETTNPTKLHLVLEDFYDDLESAALDLLKKIEQGKVSNVQKNKADFLEINDKYSGHGETTIVVPTDDNLK